MHQQRNFKNMLGWKLLRSRTVRRVPATTTSSHPSSVNIFLPKQSFSIHYRLYLFSHLKFSSGNVGKMRWMRTVNGRWWWKKRQVREAQVATVDLIFPDNELSAGKERFRKITEQICSIAVWQSKQRRNGAKLMYHTRKEEEERKINLRDDDITTIIKLQRTAYRIIIKKRGEGSIIQT